MERGNELVLVLLIGIFLLTFLFFFPCRCVYPTGLERFNSYLRVSSFLALSWSFFYPHISNIPRGLRVVLFLYDAVLSYGR